MIKRLFVYPFYKKSKPEFINFKYNIEKDIIIHGSDVSRNNKYWKTIYTKIDKKYDITPKILPKNTLIYRCSTNSNPINFYLHSNSPLIYFGLDFVISTWIALEIFNKIQKDIKYYLHIYKLKKPLKYKYIYQDSGTPYELDKDNALNHPCIHPQVILHGNTISYDINSELGTELTIPINKKYKLEKIFEPISTFEIDIKQLQKHVNDNIFEWSPINSIKI